MLRLSLLCTAHPGMHSTALRDQLDPQSQAVASRTQSSFLHTRLNLRFYCRLEWVSVLYQWWQCWGGELFMLVSPSEDVSGRCKEEENPSSCLAYYIL